MLCKFFLKMFLAGNFICQLSPLPILPLHLPAFLADFFPQPFRLYHCDGIAEAHCPGEHHLFLVRTGFKKNRAVLVLSDQLIFVPFAFTNAAAKSTIPSVSHSHESSYRIFMRSSSPVR